MDAWQCLTFATSAFVLFAFLRKLLWSPQVPNFLRSPYTQPGKFYCVHLRIVLCLVKCYSLTIGPWYPLKIIAARVWLTWKLIKIPRVLSNVIDREYNDVNSNGYNEIGKLVPTNVEIAWEQPHQLKTMLV